MGEPIRIVDMAERMIKLAGYQPGKDIHIEFVGCRPGEKLFERALRFNGKAGRASDSRRDGRDPQSCPP